VNKTKIAQIEAALKKSAVAASPESYEEIVIQRRQKSYEDFKAVLNAKNQKTLEAAFQLAEDVAKNVEPAQFDVVYTSLFNVFFKEQLQTTQNNSEELELRREILDLIKQISSFLHMAERKIRYYYDQPDKDESERAFETLRAQMEDPNYNEFKRI